MLHSPATTLHASTLLAFHPSNVVLFIAFSHCHARFDLLHWWFTSLGFTLLCLSFLLLKCHCDAIGLPLLWFLVCCYWTTLWCFYTMCLIFLFPEHGLPVLYCLAVAILACFAAKRWSIRALYRELAPDASYGGAKRWPLFLPFLF